MDLKKKKCIPCEENKTKPFSKAKAEEYLAQIKGWILSEDAKKISKQFIFDDFVKAIDFVNQVADIAEEEGHHPDIHINYNKVKLDLKTHSIGGLSENDFIVAAKVDAMALY